MKTTIDLPEALLHEAKVMAAQKRTSLKALIEQGLETCCMENLQNLRI